MEEQNTEEERFSTGKLELSISLPLDGEII